MRSTRKSIKSFLGFVLPEDLIMWHGSKKVGNNIAITFDDGPNPIYTEKIINTLQEYKIKATFFLLGSEIEKYPNIVKCLISSGHSIGNHTYSHRYNTKICRNDLILQIQKTQTIIKQTTGIISKIFRPPHGHVSISGLKYCRKNNLFTILWSIDSTDYKKADTKLILEAVNQCTVKPGDIILFHDDNEYTLEALPIIIEGLADKYEFLTIEQMMQI